MWLCGYVAMWLCGYVAISWPIMGWIIIFRLALISNVLIVIPDYCAGEAILPFHSSMITCILWAAAIATLGCL